MSNLFAVPSNFTDGTNSPPACWNGTAYVVVNSQVTLTANITPQAADTIAFTASCINSATAVLVSYHDADGDLVNLLNAQLTPTPTPYTVDLPTPGTDYFVNINPGAGCTGDTGTLVPLIVTVPLCQELGRVTRSYVSGYEASRVETRRIRRFSKRCCVANFNGAMGENVTITKIRWDCTSPWSVHMSNPRVETGGRTAAVDCSFNYAGYAGLKATATWSNGEITGVEFFFTVLDRPLYPMAEYANSSGPYVLESSV